MGMGNSSLSVTASLYISFGSRSVQGPHSPHLLVVQGYTQAECRAVTLRQFRRTMAHVKLPGSTNPSSGYKPVTETEKVVIPAPDGPPPRLKGGITIAHPDTAQIGE